MAKRILNLILFVSVLAALGCARDGASISAEKRAEIQSKTGRSFRPPGGSTAAGSGPTVRLGSFGFLGYLVDQQALLLQLALTAQKGEAGFLGGMKSTFTAGSPSDVQINLVDLQLTSKPQGSFVQKENMIWNLQSSVRNDELIYLRGVLESAQLSLDLAQKATDPKKRLFLNQFVNQSKILVQRKGDKTLLRLLIEGEMMVAKDGITERSPYSVSVNMEVESLKPQDEIVILYSKLKFELKRSRPFVVEVVSEGSLKYLNTDCPLVVGQVTLRNSGDRNAPGRIFNQTEESAWVEGSSWKVSIPACAERPLVDSSKILVY